MLLILITHLLFKTIQYIIIRDTINYTIHNVSKISDNHNYIEDVQSDKFFAIIQTIIVHLRHHLHRSNENQMWWWPLIFSNHESFYGFSKYTFILANIKNILCTKI